MQDFVVQMIINASEDVPDGALNDNRDLVTMRMDFVESYTKILECKMAGTTKQQLDYCLNWEKMCSVNIFLSTCMAILAGKLRCMDMSHSKAFSLLAMFHLAGGN